MASDFWNKEAVYDEEISPLMDKIIAICKEHSIPLVCSFQYVHAAEEDGGDGMCTTCLPFPGHECPAMTELNVLHNRIRRGFSEHVALAETITTQPDGSKHITIKRIA